MKRLVFRSWLLLLYTEYLMKFRGFMELHRVVGMEPISRRGSSQPIPSEDLCHAIDLASVFYFKPVLCLQRSAAATILLRRHGWAAEMVIGAQIVPFKSHAWCELNGIVLNDKPYMRDVYQVFDHC